MSIEVDDLAADRITDFKNADAAILGPPLFGRAAGIEKEQPVHDMICRLVAVSIYEGIEPLSAEFSEYPAFEPLRRAPAMDKTDTISIDSHNTPQWDPLNIRVHIASNGVNRNPLKSHENIGIDYISCMQDEGNIPELVSIEIIQKCQSLPEVIQMCIGKNADSCHRTEPGQRFLVFICNLRNIFTATLNKGQLQALLFVGLFPAGLL